MHNDSPVLHCPQHSAAAEAGCVAIELTPSDAEQLPKDPSTGRRSLHDDMAPKWGLQELLGPDVGSAASSCIYVKVTTRTHHAPSAPTPDGSRAI